MVAPERDKPGISASACADPMPPASFQPTRRVIRASGGNTNLTVKIPEVDALLDKALQTTDTAAREKIWGQIDEEVMKQAVIVPIVYAKALIYRPATLTNVYFNEAYQLNNYAVEGVTG